MLLNPKQSKYEHLDGPSRQIMLKTIDFFETKGKIKMKEDYEAREWYADFLEFVKKEKIFAIGFNKTGTSSMHYLFENLGLSSYHGPKWRSCELDLLSKLECFSAGPPDDFNYFEKLFMNSKFIFNFQQPQRHLTHNIHHQRKFHF